MESKKDIWVEGIKSIVSATKRSLLDYIDAFIRKATPQEKEMLEKIKARVHNDVSQGGFNMGMLFSTFRSGGDISAFESDIIKREKPKQNGEDGTISS